MALGFLLGFYLVAISIALALIAVPFLEYAALHRVHFIVLIASVGAGATILRALIPERTPWRDPGPRITAAQHPRLFERIARIAGQMGVAMPTEVYLIPQMNAFVTERGGFLGFGARRVMAIGVPMLAIENVSQLDATLAHELGHYAGGETRLSGVIYATRRAMVATLVHLEARGSGLLQKPFGAMLAAYMRITQAISRQQELVADSWSVRLAGREAHVTGLGLEQTHGLALEVFVQTEVEPLHRAGRAPANVFEGYRRFAASPAFARVSSALERVGSEPADPYDSHPTLAERIAFAATVESAPVPMDTTPASTLLDDAAAVEAQLSSTMAPEGVEAMTWDDVGDVWATHARRSAVRLTTASPGFDIAALERALTDAAETARVAELLVPSLRGYQLPDRFAKSRAAVVEFGACWLGAVLAEHGWTLTAELGESVRMRLGDTTLDLRARLMAVVDGAEPVTALRAVAPDVLREGVVLTLTDAERPSPTARAPTVTFTRGKPYSEVSGRLRDLVFPVCCARCTGPTDTQYLITITKEGLSIGSTGITLALYACPRHVSNLGYVVRLRRHDKQTDQVVLAVLSADYAELIARASEPAA